MTASRPKHPLRYVTRAMVSLAGRFVGFSAAACSVYMIERSVGILENALRYHVPIGAFFSLVVLQLPALAEFALPIALFASAHLLLVGSRERREFVALAAAGLSGHLIVRPVAAMGIAGFLLSLAFSDVISPAATRTYHQIESAARASILVHGIPDGRFFANADTVLYTAQGPRGSGNVRLFQFRDGTLERLLTSDCARPERNGTDILIRLCNGDIYLMSSEREPMHVSVGNTIYPLDTNALFGGYLGRAASGMSIGQLLASGKAGNRADSVRGLSRVLSAFACLLAGSLAVLSASFAAYRTRTTVFAAGALVMLLVMAIRNSLAASLTGLFTPALLGIGVIVFVLASIVPGILAEKLHRRLIAPAMVKT